MGRYQHESGEGWGRGVLKSSLHAYDHETCEMSVDVRNLKQLETWAGVSAHCMSGMEECHIEVFFSFCPHPCERETRIGGSTSYFFWSCFPHQNTTTTSGTPCKVATQQWCLSMDWHQSCYVTIIDFCSKPIGESLLDKREWNPAQISLLVLDYCYCVCSWQRLTAN